MEYLRNCWYAAAWDTEVGSTLFARQILGESILLYRKEDGTAVALSNRCPHRFAPLDKGKRVGDVVECPYHGLQFDWTGRCVKNPHPGGDGPIPPRAVVPAYALLEKWGVLWIWMGAERPVESLLPDLDWLEQTSRHHEIRNMRSINAHYQLIADNLLDLTRRPSAGAAGLGVFTLDSGPRYIAEDLQGSQESNTFWSRYSSRQVPLHPELRRFIPGWADSLCDKSNSARWSAPGHVAVSTEYRRAGTAQEQPLMLRTAAMLTPADENHTWMFWSLTRNFAPASEELDALLRGAAASELEGSDLAIVESQHRNLATSTPVDFFTGSFVALPGDVAPMRARRALRGMIDEERQRASCQQAGRPRAAEPMSLAVSGE